MSTGAHSASARTRVRERVCMSLVMSLFPCKAELPDCYASCPNKTPRRRRGYHDKTPRPRRGYHARNAARASISFCENLATQVKFRTLQKNSKAPRRIAAPAETHRAAPRRAGATAIARPIQPQDIIIGPLLRSTGGVRIQPRRGWVKAVWGTGLLLVVGAVPLAAEVPETAPPGQPRTGFGAPAALLQPCDQYNPASPAGNARIALDSGDLVDRRGREREMRSFIETGSIGKVECAVVGATPPGAVRTVSAIPDQPTVALFEQAAQRHRARRGARARRSASAACSMCARSAPAISAIPSSTTELRRRRSGAAEQRQAARSAAKSPSSHHCRTAARSRPTDGPGAIPSAVTSRPVSGKAGGCHDCASASIRPRVARVDHAVRCRQQRPVAIALAAEPGEGAPLLRRIAGRRRVEFRRPRRRQADETVALGVGQPQPRRHRGRPRRVDGDHGGEAAQRVRQRGLRRLGQAAADRGASLGQHHHQHTVRCRRAQDRHRIDTQQPAAGRPPPARPTVRASSGSAGVAGGPRPSIAGAAAEARLEPVIAADTQHVLGDPRRRITGGFAHDAPPVRPDRRPGRAARRPDRGRSR